MASYTPPTETLPIFDNAVFNSVNGSTVLTVSTANLLYLRKTYADTATALETFNAGILVNTIQPTATTTTMLINSTMTSGDMYIGSNAAASNARTGVIHIGDSNNIASGGAVHINNGTSNTSNTQIMNGLTTSGNLNLMTGGSCSGSINIGTGNISNPTINILTGQTCTGALNIGTNTVGVSTVPVSINTGNQSGAINMGNSGNAFQVNSGTIQVGTTNGAQVLLLGQEAATGTVKIAGGGGVNTATVQIANGTTSGAVTIGNTGNTVNVNGSLTIGTGKNITLQPTAGYTAPTQDTMLGGITEGTFTLPTFPATATFQIASIDLVKATYLIYFCFQIDCSGAPTQAWVNMGGTALPLPSQYRFGYTTIISTTNYGLTGSFPISITTAGTLTLGVQFTGTINSINIKKYQAVRIA